MFPPAMARTIASRQSSLVAGTAHEPQLRTNIAARRLFGLTDPRLIHTYGGGIAGTLTATDHPAQGRALEHLTSNLLSQKVVRAWNARERNFSTNIINLLPRPNACNGCKLKTTMTMNIKLMTACHLLCVIGFRLMNYITVHYSICSRFSTEEFQIQFQAPHE